MTIYQEAKQLVKKYALLHRGENEKDWIDKDIVFDEIDKQCAIIAVEQMHRVMISFWEKFKINENSRSSYLDGIIKEIEKL